MNDHYTERQMEHADYLLDELKDRELEREFEKSQRPQDGRICDCEDAHCCGHYDIG